MNQVYFDDIGSYDDLGLFLSDVSKGPADPKRITVDVPGMDGLLELTKSICSKMRYKNRKITLEFAVKNYQSQWLTIFSEVENKLHGRTFKVVIEPDADWYWNAFCKVSKTKSNKNKGIIVVELDAFPYKFKEPESLRIWAVISDTFQYTTVQVQGDEIILHFELPSRMYGGSIYVEYAGETYTFHEGDLDTEILISADEDQVGIRSDTGGWVTASYQDRIL